MLRVSPHEAKTEYVAGDAPLARRHEHLFADPLARCVALRGRMLLQVYRALFADDARLTGGSLTKDSQRGDVVDLLGSAMRCEVQQIRRSLYIGGLRHCIGFQMIHAGGAVVNAVDVL